MRLTLLMPHDSIIADCDRERKQIQSLLSDARIPLLPICLPGVLLDGGSPSVWKERIKSCTLAPPRFAKGFVYRPLVLGGMDVSGAESPCSGHLCTELWGRRAPCGLLYALAPEASPCSEAAFPAAAPISLRVFRLLSAEIRLSESPLMSACWELDREIWVKLARR